MRIEVVPSNLSMASCAAGGAFALAALISGVEVSLVAELAATAGAILLAAAVWLSWQIAWRWFADKADNVLRADVGYWVCMFIAGTLGTVIGDFCSHNLRLDDAGAMALLSPMVAVLFLIGRRGPLRLLPFYWLTVVAIRAAGTAVGDFVSGRNMLGLPLSTAVTGILFVALLLIWKQSGRPAQAVAVAP